MHFVPEERLGCGAVPTLSLAQNTLLTRTEAVNGGWVSVAATRRLARHLSEAKDAQRAALVFGEVALSGS